jgi:hypothetical protein
MGLLNCKHCQKTFETTRKDKFFCSLTCTYTFSNHNYERKCAVCDSIFKGTRYKKYCSRKCNIDDIKFKKNKEFNKCFFCKKEFIINRRHRVRLKKNLDIYCSRICGRSSTVKKNSGKKRPKESQIKSVEKLKILNNWRKSIGELPTQKIGKNFTRKLENIEKNICEKLNWTYRYILRIDEKKHGYYPLNICEIKKKRCIILYISISDMKPKSKQIKFLKDNGWKVFQYSLREFEYNMEKILIEVQR